MYCIQVKNFDEWRKHARELLKRRIPPGDITWQTGKQTSLLFNDKAGFLSHKILHTELSIPRDFFSLAKNVVCYRDESRWSLLYSVAWRLIFEDRRLLNFNIDTQVSRLLSMQKAVARDKHKMKAFVRFREVNKPFCHGNSKQKKAIQKEEYFVSWFEPEHHILRAVSPFFVKRFNNMRWSILTPDLCVHWDLQQVSFSEGISRAPPVEDELENLWLEYYANIFNPARLKLQAMQAEMPKKYWANLPEASIIPELTNNAGKRVESMIRNSYISGPLKQQHPSET